MPVTSPIRLDAISKCYRIFQNPQDRFKQALLDRFGHVVKKRTALYREHWVLRDISFELRSGEAIGIIGRNGAGKSTLLQIIAGTVAPTGGSVLTQGRIAALLELGSGFNPEFTGRENVFLNAEILGLSRADAREKFDDIATFADIGDFIEQPVKTYSSGMVMRLAFAVQTALDPDVLIVDEALAVGDARFQDKCFRKLRDLREAGTTILFVSHDINAVTSFCDRAVFLEDGKLAASGSPKEVSRSYIASLYSDGANAKKKVDPGQQPALTAREAASPSTTEDRSFQFGNDKVKILDIGLIDDEGRRTNLVVSGKRYTIVQRIRANADVEGLSSGFIIRNHRGVDLFGITNKTARVHIPPLSMGEIVEVEVDIDAWLAAGDYFVQAANASEDGVQLDCRIDALHFRVVDTPMLFATSIVNLNPTFRFERNG